VSAERFRLVKGYLLTVVRAERPQGEACAACGRPWRDHPDGHQPYPCERCGVWFAFDCYRAIIASEAEQVRWDDPDDDGEGLTFLCRGCRSCRR